MKRETKKQLGDIRKQLLVLLDDVLLFTCAGDKNDLAQMRPQLSTVEDGLMKATSAILEILRDDSL